MGNIIEISPRQDVVPHVLKAFALKRDGGLFVRTKHTQKQVGRPTCEGWERPTDRKEIDELGGIGED